MSETNNHLKAVRYSADQHGINRDIFDSRAIRIVEQLNEAGFEAYLVGGCLRDALLGIKPKDFDVATNASPEEVKEIFRNCRLIGRRFRLAHIHFGRDIFEVATFRSDAQKEVKVDSEGHVVDDNVYGTLEDDVIRRDFTINALYYDIQADEIIDFLDGYQDVKNKTIRLIGEATARYIEDPVRMLRAARFAAKLPMKLEVNAKNAIAQCKENLRAVPPARLFDEIQKLFMSGYGVKSYETLKEYGLFEELFPDISRVAKSEQAAFAEYIEKMMLISLSNTDQRIADKKPVTIAFLLATFFWGVYQLQYQGLLRQGENWHDAMHHAVDIVLLAANERVSVPMRFKSMIREIWTLQARLQLGVTSEKKTVAVLGYARFRAAYDFMMIRMDAGEDLQGYVHWWSIAQNDAVLMNKVHQEKEELLSNSPENEVRKPRRRYTRRKKS